MRYRCLSLKIHWTQTNAGNLWSSWNLCMMFCSSCSALSIARLQNTAWAECRILESAKFCGYMCFMCWISTQLIFHTLSAVVSFRTCSNTLHEKLIWISCQATVMTFRTAKYENASASEWMNWRLWSVQRPAADAAQWRKQKFDSLKSGSEKWLDLKKYIVVELVAEKTRKQLPSPLPSLNFNRLHLKNRSKPPQKGKDCSNHQFSGPWEKVSGSVPPSDSQNAKTRCSLWRSSLSE